jgi:probable rRNA maturation factor
MIEVEVQRVAVSRLIPGDASLQKWARHALGESGDACLTIRVVDEKESADLNRRFRCKEGATNVLSFLADLPPEVGSTLLGDIVICAPVVAAEAVNQEIDMRAHWAHMVIHGVLHLIGFDHQSEADALVMESKEIELLAALGFPDPYD